MLGEHLEGGWGNLHKGIGATHRHRPAIGIQSALNRESGRENGQLMVEMRHRRSSKVAQTVVGGICASALIYWAYFFLFQFLTNMAIMSRFAF
jgi:hypothetical protein